MLGIVLGTGWQKLVKWLMTTLVVAGLALSVVSCGKSGAPTIPGISKAANRLSEVAPPAALLELRSVLDVHQPQVTVLSPRSDEVFQDTTVSVRLRVNDLPLFQDAELGLGPHLHFILDNQPYEAIYDVSEPILLQDLTPGTHTIRVFASRPWHESFKNEGAYAQTTFHIFTKTPDNNPSAAQPLLTYSRPKGSYGAEPVMLDFYLANAPLHLVAKEDAEDDIIDWQIRATVNGESFTFDRWEPIYLKGWQSGRNWVQLELLDQQGNPYPNAFNTTVRLIDYQPGGLDTLSQLIRGELSAADARRIVDPNYVPPKPELEPGPEPEVTPVPEVETVPEPTLEPGDIPEVAPDQLPDQLPDQSIVAPTVPETPASLPSDLNPDLEPEVDRSPASPVSPTIPKTVPKAVEPDPLPPTITAPTAIEPPQATKVKEQLTEEVEEQLEELENANSSGAEATSIEETLDLLVPPAASPGAFEAPIAPPQVPTVAEPDDKEKLFDRAKRFLDRVIPRPSEPAETPSIAPTVEAPAVDSPEDAVVIEEILTNPTLKELLNSPEEMQILDSTVEK